MNAHLEECNGSIDLAGRLQQLFLDADDLLSDINGEISFALLELENSPSPLEEVAVEQTISVLRTARNKVQNIVHDFQIHYVLTSKDQTQAGLEALVQATNNYKRG